jgi:hypothetical protein
MSKELAKTSKEVALSPEIIEKVAGGDLGQLTPRERVEYFVARCEELGLNPASKPFGFIRFEGTNRVELYALKACTDQLRALRKISLVVVSEKTIGDVFVVRVRASLPDGRTDEDDGAVSIAGLKGNQHANALMKALTKAKRRVTLSICGLGILDESELETVANARVEPVAVQAVAATPTQAPTPKPPPVVDAEVMPETPRPKTLFSYQELRVMLTTSETLEALQVAWQSVVSSNKGGMLSAVDFKDLEVFKDRLKRSFLNATAQGATP